MQTMLAAEVLKAARTHWEAGRPDEARAVLAGARVGAAAQEHSIKLAQWAYGEAFLAPVLGRRVTLVRRSPTHLEFVRSAWTDRGFMERFHRFPRALPADDDALADILHKEARATLLDGRHLHWTIVGAQDEQPVGMASLAEIALQHRRAEFIVGVRGAATGAALEASLLALEFGFRTAGLQKIHATIYGGNDYALTSATHLGFREEGRLRRHVKDPHSGQFVDLSLLGLLAEEFYSMANQRLARRLLGRDLVR